MVVRIPSVTRVLFFVCNAVVYQVMWLRWVHSNTLRQRVHIRPCTVCCKQRVLLMRQLRRWYLSDVTHLAFSAMPAVCSASCQAQCMQTKSLIPKAEHQGNILQSPGLQGRSSAQLRVHRRQIRHPACSLGRCSCIPTTNTLAHPKKH